MTQTKTFINMPVAAINQLKDNEIMSYLSDMTIKDLKKLSTTKFTVFGNSDIYVSKRVSDIVLKTVNKFFMNLSLQEIIDNDLFYSLIGYGDFYSFSKEVAIDISFKNIKGNSNTCCVQVNKFKDGVLLISHGWDAARPRFGKLLHKENQYYFSKVDFVDSKKFKKVDKPFGFFN